MSAFLAPIHYMMYRKICLQNGLDDYLATLFINDTSAQEQLKQLLETGHKDLEEFIIPGEIHASLVELISKVDVKMAKVISTILHAQDATLEEIVKAATDFGKNFAFPADFTDLGTIFQQLNQTVLAGMPCDMLLQVTQEDDKSLTWQYRTDTVAEIFAAEDVPSSAYYQVIGGLIIGLVSNLPVAFAVNQDRKFTLTIK